MYKIIFVYNDVPETIDTADNLTEAKYLLSEYQLAFRNVRNAYVYINNQ